MADWYVDSAAAGSGSGANWANAMNRLAFACNSSAAGDRIFIASSSDEKSTSGNTSVALNGTITSPLLIMSVNKGGSVPPVAADYVSGASVATDGVDMVLRGIGQVWGVNFADGIGTGGGFVFNIGTVVSGTYLYLKDCHVACSGSGAGNRINIGRGSDCSVEVFMENATVAFNNAGGQIVLNGGYWEWRGGLLGGVAPTKLTGAVNNGLCTNVFFHGVDLSIMGGASSFFDVSGDPVIATLTDCKLGASVSATTGSWSANGRMGSVAFVNCDSANTGYRNEFYNYFGTMTTETTITLSTAAGGASDGVQKYSWKLVSGANVTPSNPFIAPLIAYDNTATGSTVTGTLEVISSSGGNNSDVWTQLEYLGNGSFPISSFIADTRANPLATLTSQTSSSVTWDSSPPTAVKQKMANSFNPQIAGWVYGYVYVGRANSTYYVNPALTVA